LFTWISALQGLLSPVGKALVLPLGAVALGEAVGVVDALGTGAVSVTGVTSQACFFWKCIRIITYFFAFLSIFTHFYAFLRIFTHYYAFLRIFTHFYAFLHIFKHFYALLRILKASNLIVFFYLTCDQNAVIMFVMFQNTYYSRGRLM
jgi:hypothetical protein